MDNQKFAKAQAKEKMLDGLFEYASICHIENILSENPIEKKIDLPPEFDRKMKKLISKQSKQLKRLKFKQKTKKVLPRAAVFLLILLGSFTLLVNNVEALRVKVLNIFLNIHDQYTSFQATKNNNTIPQNWNGYLPFYMPSGFEISKIEQNNLMDIIYYTNHQGQSIEFSQSKGDHSDMRIDTEDALVQNITINNSEALLAEKNGLISIVWRDEFAFCLIGNVDKSELIKVAKNVRKYQK